MNNECKIAFSKAKELIRRNKERFGLESIPEIQSFDNGEILLQYFNTWENFWIKTKLKNFTDLNDNKKRKIKLVFSEEGNNVDITDFKKNKTYIILNGEIEFYLKNGESKKVSTMETLDIPKEIPHGGLTIRDTYVIVIES
jgi:hypothetical protein